MSDPSRPDLGQSQDEAVRANYRREEVREKCQNGEQTSRPQPPDKTTVRTRGGVTDVRYVLGHPACST
jgi:hypothetical protein